MKKIKNIIRIWLAVKIKRLRPFLLSNDEKNKIIIFEIKDSFKSMGFDISEMTDLEFKQVINNASYIALKAGVTLDDFKEVMNRFSDSLKDVKINEN